MHIYFKNTCTILMYIGFSENSTGSQLYKQSQEHTFDTAAVCLNGLWQADL